MRWVASVVVAFAVTATLCAASKAAPAKTDADGREQLHTGKQDSAFDTLWRSLPFSLPELRWPPFGPSKPAKVETGGPDQPHAEEQHFLYFSGSDAWPHWAFAHTGVLWSPAGLSNEGFTLKVLLNSGAYGYRAGALNNTNILGRQTSIAAMPGWRFKRGGFEFTLFAGFELQQFRFLPDDPDSRLRGRHMGLRAGVELWHEPSPTTMLAADASISSIGAGNSVRAAYGWKLFDRLYLGPEAQAFSTDNYLHARAGVHVTALKFGEREWSGAIGIARDNDHRSGLYARVGVLVRR